MAQKYNPASSACRGALAPFLRANAFPLDKSSLFNTFDEAKIYALNNSGTSYLGQTLAVVQELEGTPGKYSVKYYIIVDDTENPLKEVGSGQQIQVDWNVTDSTSPAFILNKPNVITKVIDSEENNFAVFDNKGNLKDISINADMFATAEQGELAVSALQEDVITDTIDRLSEDSKVPSAKAVYNYSQPKLTDTDFATSIEIDDLFKWLNISYTQNGTNIDIKSGSYFTAGDLGQSLSNISSIDLCIEKTKVADVSYSTSADRVTVSLSTSYDASTYSGSTKKVCLGVNGSWAGGTIYTTEISLNIP